MASIRLVNVLKRYSNDQVAVRDFNLEIRNGELLALVGPSGCGKSTTLRMVAGLEEVSEGDIYIDDRRVNDVDPGKRDVAMVFQNYALYPHMSVRENMSFGLKMRKTPKREVQKRVDEAAELLSIGSLLDRRPAQLSGGQRQRVAVGRAIVREPLAFLFDEPLSNLDAKLRVQMRRELAELHHRLQTTTIYVTHDQVEAMTLGQRIVVMHEGEIQQVATPLELYEQPANRFVASFIGNPAMNLLPGRIEHHEGQAFFQNQQFRFPVSLAGEVPESSTVTFGFRPEHVTLAEGEPELANVSVDIVERLGDETLISFQLAGTPCVARLSGDIPCHRGDSLVIRLQADKWYLFSGDSGGLLAATGGK